MPNTFYTYQPIAATECLGDSLFKINNNNNFAAEAIGDLETRITTVSGVLKSQIDLKENEFTVLPILSGGTGATTAANARTNLGLGSIATLNSIANANVIAGAGIEGTKISSNFGSQQVYSTGNFTTTSYMWANGLVYAGNNKVQIGGGGLGGDQAGYIVFNVPGHGLARYWGGYTWSDVYSARVGVATNGDMYVGGTATLPNIVANNVYSYNYYNISDERFKDNITPLQNSLNTVLNLKGISYTEKGTGRKQIGFSAQQIKPVLPEVVSQAENGYLSVSYANVVAVLVEAVKELSSKVNNLENNIAQLVNKS